MTEITSWAKAPDPDRPEHREQLRANTERDRHEQLNAGLRPVTCAQCGVRVLAKKNSRDHTSVQWTNETVRECAEFGARTEPGEPTAHIDTCTALRDSIEKAVRSGQVPIPE